MRETITLVAAQQLSSLRNIHDNLLVARSAFMGCAARQEIVRLGFHAETRLQHLVADYRVRFSAAGWSVVFTGDTTPRPAVVELSHCTSLLVQGHFFEDEVPADTKEKLPSRSGVVLMAVASGSALTVMNHIGQWTSASRNCRPKPSSPKRL